MLLASTAALVAIMPALAAAVSDARRARVLVDESAIATAILTFRSDLGRDFFTHDGSGVAGNKVSLLVSDGDMPRECQAPNNGCGGGADTWDRVTGNGTGVLVDFLERHLVTNDPGGSSANDYPVTGGNRWRGAYLTAPIDPDPYGNRYMVNVGRAQAPGRVIVLSAGENEIIECDFNEDGPVPDYAPPDCFAGTTADDVITLVGD